MLAASFMSRRLTEAEETDRRVLMHLRDLASRAAERDRNNGFEVESFVCMLSLGEDAWAKLLRERTEAGWTLADYGQETSLVSVSGYWKRQAPSTETAPK